MSLFKRLLFVVTLSLLITVSNAQVFDSLSLPKVWLRGDVGTVTSSLWSDESGHGTNATAALGEGPSVNGLFNYNESLIFDGDNDYMKILFSLEGLSEISLIVIYQSADTTERGIMGAENGLSRIVDMSTRNVLGPDSVVDNYGKNEKLPILGSVIQSWNKALVSSTDAYLALGSTGKSKGGKYFKGAIAEVMVFDHGLSFLKRRQIETYLAIKYGITASGNYVSSGEKLLWDVEKDIEYSNRMAGIGRDDAFGLYQKQSKSSSDTTDLIIISVGSLAETNKENLSTLNNQDFLVWGDNNNTLEVDTIGNKDSRLAIINRRWEMNTSGQTVSSIPTTIQFKLNGLPQDSLGYWLVIDRSGEGNFNADNLEYIFPDSISHDSIAYYNTIKWDTDRSGKDMFGFARAMNLFAVVRTLEKPLCSDPESGKILVEVIAGKGPYSFQMASTSRDFALRWQGDSEKEQDYLIADNYSIKVNDANNSEFVREFDLPLADGLKIDLGEDRTISEGQEIELDATTFIPDSIQVTYLWESNNAFSSTEGKIIAMEPGVYNVIITNDEGCEFSDDIVLGGSLAKEFNVFPNITSGDFKVGVSLEEAGPATVEIYDTKGTVHQVMAGDGSSEYLFKGFINDPGIYFIVLKTEYGVESQKLIVN